MHLATVQKGRKNDGFPRRKRSNQVRFRHLTTSFQIKGHFCSLYMSISTMDLLAHSFNLTLFLPEIQLPAVQPLKMNLAERLTEVSRFVMILTLRRFQENHGPRRKKMPKDQKC